MKFRDFFRNEVQNNNQTEQSAQESIKTPERAEDVGAKKLLDLAKLMEFWYNKHILLMSQLPQENIEKEKEEEEKQKKKFLELKEGFKNFELEQAWALTKDSANRPLDKKYFRQCIEDLEKPYGVF